MSLFLLTFFLLYGGTHLYLFLKIKSAVPFSVVTGACLALFLLVMMLAPILVRVAEKEGMESPARLLAYTGYLWMGFLFLFFSSSLVIDLYHGFLHVAGYVFGRDLRLFFLSNRIALIIPLAWGIISAVYGYFEALNIRTERITLSSPKIAPSPGRVTIVQISDVHLGLIVRKDRLKAIIDLVEAAAPDILVSTGDLVDGQINGLAGLAEMLREVTPRYGKYAVTGNHELYAGFSHSNRFMESAGFRVLRGEEVTLPGVITIAGVDDPAIGRTAGSASEEENRLLTGFPKETYCVLLKHRPVIQQASRDRFDLQLSGHVHKGQIFPFNLITYLFYPVKAGLNRNPQGSLLYVSRGSGTWGPPIRFLAPPEVTIIELVHSSSSR
jgi:predicted MPP superfamily phosphohydrolase